MRKVEILAASIMWLVLFIIVFFLAKVGMYFDIPPIAAWILAALIVAFAIRIYE